MDMIFTEKTSIWHINFRVTCTIKVNIKETLLKNQFFANVYMMNGKIEWTCYFTNFISSEKRRKLLILCPH